MKKTQNILINFYKSPYLQFQIAGSVSAVGGIQEFAGSISGSGTFFQQLSVTGASMRAEY